MTDNGNRHNDSIFDFIEVLRDNIAFVKERIENVQAQFALVVGDFDEKLEEAHRTEWPLESDPNNYVGFHYYRAMRRSSSSSAKYICKRYEEADQDVTGLGLLDLLFLVEITENELDHVEQLLDQPLAEAAVSNLKTWIHTALVQIRRINSLVRTEHAQPQPPRLTAKEARKSQASLKVEINKLNRDIHKTEEPLKLNFFEMVSAFYRLMKVATLGIQEDEISDLIEDQERRIRLYKAKVEQALDQIAQRNATIDKIWALSEVGRSMPKAGPGVLVTDAEISADEIDYWTSIEENQEEAPRTIHQGRHADFDDLEEDDAHPQYLLRSGDHLTGDVEHLEGTIDGLRLSEHRHTGEDGSKQIHGSDIIPGTLKDEKVDYDDSPPRPENLSIEGMEIDSVPPGFVAVETTLGWDSYDRYMHDLEVRLVSLPEGFELFDEYADLIWVTGHRTDSENQPSGPVLFAVDPANDQVKDFTAALPTFEHIFDLGGDPSMVSTKQGAIADYSNRAVMILNMNDLLYRRFFPFNTTGDQLKYWEELEFPVLYDDLSADRSLASDGTILGYIAKGELGELIISLSEDLGDSWVRETNPTLADGRAITCIDWSNGRWYRWCDSSPIAAPASFEWWAPPEVSLPPLPGWSYDFEGGFGQFSTSGSYVNLDTAVVHSGSQSVKLDGDGEHNSARVLSVTCDVGGGGATITFWGRVQSEYSYDFLRFYVNGVEKGSWSGDWSWSEFSFTLPEGEVQLEWQYTKDSSVSELEDAAWVDNISVTNSALPGQEIPEIETPSRFDGMTWTTVTLPDNSEKMVNIVVTYAGGETWVLTAGETSGHDDYYYISADDGATWRDFNNFAGGLDPITVRGETNTAYRGGAMALDSEDTAYGYYQNIGQPVKGDPLPDLPIHPDLNWDIEHAGLFKAKKTWYLSPNGAIAGVNFRAEDWHVIEIDKEIIVVDSGVANTFVGSRIFTQPDEDQDIGKPGIYFFISTVNEADYWGEDRLLIVDPDDPTQHTLAHSLPLPPWEGPWPDGYYFGPIEQSWGYAPSAATVAISDGVPTLFVYTNKAEVWKSKTLHPTEASDWIFLGAVADPLITAAENKFTYGDHNSMASYGENIKILVQYITGSNRGYDEFRPNFMIESFDGGETWRSVRLPYAYGAIQSNNNFWWRYSGAVYTGTYIDPDQEWGISQDGRTWQDFSEFGRPSSTPQPADIDSMAWKSDGQIGLAQDGSTIWVTENGGENWVDLFVGGYSCWVDKNDNLMIWGTSGQIWLYQDGQGRPRQVADNVLDPGSNNVFDGSGNGVGLIATDATINSYNTSDLYRSPDSYLINPTDDESTYTDVSLPAETLNVFAVGSYRDVIRASEQERQDDWYIRPNLRDEWGSDGRFVDNNPYLDAALLFSVDTTDRRIAVGDLMTLHASSWGYSGFSYYTRWVDLPPGWNYAYRYESDPDTNFYTTMIQLIAYKIVDETDVSGKRYDFYIEALNDNFANQGNAQDHGWHVAVSRVSEDKNVVSLGDPTSYMRYSTDGPRDWELDTPKAGHRILTLCHRTDRITVFITQETSPMAFTDYESGNMVYKGTHDHSIGFFGGSTMPAQKTRVRTERTGNEGSYQVITFIPVYLENEISGFTDGNAFVFAMFTAERPISGSTTGTASGIAAFAIA